MAAGGGEGCSGEGSAPSHRGFSSAWPYAAWLSSAACQRATGQGGSAWLRCPAAQAPVSQRMSSSPKGEMSIQRCSAFSPCEEVSEGPSPRARLAERKVSKAFEGVDWHGGDKIMFSPKAAKSCLSFSPS